jgi:hypothetical protein
MVCCVEPKQQHMDDRKGVEVYKQMPERMLLIIRLEGRVVPVDAVETHETLCWWNVDQTSLTEWSTPIGQRSYVSGRGCERQV